jgi:hypothetical protein
MWRRLLLQQSSDSFAELDLCCHHALERPMFVDGHNDDKLSVWMHVSTRDHLFVKILVVHEC